MNKIPDYLRKNPLSFLLLFIPLALIAEILHWSGLLIFLFSALSLVPLAGFIGSSTEALAAYTGPKIGGLLNATLGNAAELIITLVAISKGPQMLELVKASITGSIIGNLLLVLGMAMLIGGLKYKTQKFDRQQAGNHATLMTLAIIALVIPSLFSHSIGADTSTQVEALSLGVAGVMIVLYVLGLIFSLKSTASSPLTYPPEEEKHHHSLTKAQAFLILAVSTIGVVFMSEMLVGTVETVTESLGFSTFFIGIVLIPIIGNVAEHLVAVQVAARNKMDLAVEISVSSSLQIALFVAPVLVFISLLMGNPLTLIFNQFELVALGAAVIIATMVSSDGESNWLEGSALSAVYAILAIAFFLLK